LISRSVVSVDASRGAVSAQPCVDTAPPAGAHGRPAADPTTSTTSTTDKKWLTDRREGISSAVLENHLLAHSAVAEVSVVDVLDGTWGTRPAAVVVIRDGEHVTFDELRGHLLSKVAAWQVPAWWAMIPELPAKSAGTANEKVLRRRYADGWRGSDIATASR
jgi:hypothetical protein